MENKLIVCEKKINILLERFLDGKCLHNGHKQLDKFLECLAKQDESEDERGLLSLSIFTDWPKKAVEKWAFAETKPDTCVLRFALSVTSLLSKKEAKFSSLNSDNFFTKLIGLVEKANLHSTSCLKLEYVKLLSSFLEHKSGVALISANYFCENVFQWGLSDYNDEITLECHKFLSKLLEKTIAYDENFSDNIVKRVLSPLNQKIFNSLTDSKVVGLTQKTMSEYLRPTFRLIGNLLDHFLEKLLSDDEDLKVLTLFVKNFSVEERVPYFMVASTKGFMFELAKIIFIIEFVEIYIKILAKKATMFEIDSSVRSMKNNFVSSISKGSFQEVLEFCKFGQLFWTLVDRKVSQVESNGTRDPRDFGSQLLVIQILPVSLCPLNFYGSRSKVIERMSEDFRENYIYRVLKIVGEDVWRVLCRWRVDLRKRQVNFFRISLHSLHYMKISRKHFRREIAVVIFQSCFYNLKDFSYLIGEVLETFDEIYHESLYFARLFEMLRLLIDDFEISWRDSVEATDVISLAFEYITMPFWCENVKVQALKLIETAIENCIAEPMALLIDKTDDSTIDLLGPLLYAEASSEAPEVKIEIFEIVTAMARISKDSKLIIDTFFSVIAQIDCGDNGAKMVLVCFFF